MPQRITTTSQKISNVWILLEMSVNITLVQNAGVMSRHNAINYVKFDVTLSCTLIESFHLKFLFTNCH